MFSSYLVILSESIRTVRLKGIFRGIRGLQNNPLLLLMYLHNLKMLILEGTYNNSHDIKKCKKIVVIILKRVREIDTCEAILMLLHYTERRLFRENRLR